MKRILFLSDINSPHTHKWVSSLVKKDGSVGVFSLNPRKVILPDEFDSVSLFCSGKAGKAKQDRGLLSKLSYLKAVPEIKEAIRKFKPDIIHAHYASSYGLLGALSRFHPFVLSVWGSDVYRFPRQGTVARWILKYNLRKADAILSTSRIMAEETRLYTDKRIEITPFGVDLNRFCPREAFVSLFPPGSLVVGTVKALEEPYGISYLLEAFALLRKRHPRLPLKLLVVGGGSLEQALKRKSYELNIAQDTVFTGRVSSSEVPSYHNMITVFAALSNEESFGVAAVEAMACGKATVVSEAPGLAEVVKDGITGLIVPRKNPEAAAEAIEKLLINEQLCKQMGTEGRRRAEKFYNWDKNLKDILDIYESL